MSSTDLLLISRDSSLGDRVQGAFSKSLRFRYAGSFGTLTELVARLHREVLSAVLIDLDPNPSAMMSDLETLIGRFGQTRFVLISRKCTNELILEAMRIGARHVTSWDQLPTLGAVLERLVPEGQATQKTGSLITVLSSAGGCGATMAAINVANEISLDLSEPVLLADFDQCYGGAAAYLGIKATYGLGDVLTHRSTIDPQLIRSSAAVHGPLHVLVSPVSIQFSNPSPLQMEKLGEFLEACKHGYAHTVIDAPRVSMDVASALAAASRCVLLVMQLTVKDLSTAKAIHSCLVERGISPENIKPVISRYVKRHPMVDLDVAKRALGRNHLECISNDFRSALRAVNYGKTLAEVAPMSPLRRDVRRLAEMAAYLTAAQA